MVPARAPRRRARSAPWVPVHAVRRRDCHGPSHRRPAPPCACRVVRRRAWRDRAVHRRRVRRTGAGRRWHAVGRRDARRRPGRVPAGGEVQPGPLPGGAAAVRRPVSHGVGLPVRRRAARRALTCDSLARPGRSWSGCARARSPPYSAWWRAASTVRGRPARDASSTLSPRCLASATTRPTRARQRSRLRRRPPVRAARLPWRVVPRDDLWCTSEPTLRALLEGRHEGATSRPRRRLPRAIIAVTVALCQTAVEYGLRTVCLSGGVMQNHLLVSPVGGLSGAGPGALINGGYRSTTAASATARRRSPPHGCEG